MVLSLLTTRCQEHMKKIVLWRSESRGPAHEWVCFNKVSLQNTPGLWVAFAPAEGRWMRSEWFRCWWFFSSLKANGKMVLAVEAKQVRKHSAAGVGIMLDCEPKLRWHPVLLLFLLLAFSVVREAFTHGLWMPPWIQQSGLTVGWASKQCIAAYLKNENCITPMFTKSK